VAGLKEIQDIRPDNEKEYDQYYDKPTATTINERMYRHLKTSGVFKDVLLGKFDNSTVDVIIDPKVNHFFYTEKLNGWTAVSCLFAISGFPWLVYILVGGPGGDHYAEADLGLEMTTVEGKVLATGSGEKKFSMLSNIHNTTTYGRGASDGIVLNDALYDTLSSLSMNIQNSATPTSKFSQLTACGSDKDCKGDRICVDGKCSDPERKDL